MPGEGVAGAALAGRPAGEDRRNYSGGRAKFNGDAVGAIFERGMPANRPAPPAPYVTSPIKRRRRTKSQIGTLRDGLEAIVAADHPMTVRQIFYRAVVAGLIEKTEAEYKCTIARLLLEMRQSGQLPYSWIADNTRWMRKPRTYTGLADFIDSHQQAYRRDLWNGADLYLEIWCEKESLAGVLYDVTAQFDVPLMVSRGFASESYLYSAADAITDQLSDAGSATQAIIYYFGDYDPSGFHISQSIETGLRRLCGELLNGFRDEHLIFERVAVTEEQVKAWRLPSRPTKLAGNNHAKNWPDGRPSVELDAIPPRGLRALARHCIEQHVDQHHLHQLRVIEEEERHQLRLFGQQIAEARQ
jgi:hypothetical protein